MDALWENYRDWSGYQYALANPVKLFDKNGRWARDADNPQGGYWTRAESMVNVITYEKCLQIGANNIANYIKDNLFYVRSKSFKDLYKMGQVDISDPNRSILEISELAALNKKELVSTVIHEVVHLKGYKEYSAFAAEFAFGRYTDEQIIHMFQDTATYRMEDGTSYQYNKYITEGMATEIRDKFFTVEGTLTNDPMLQALFIESYKKYGMSILGQNDKVEK